MLVGYASPAMRVFAHAAQSNQITSTDWGSQHGALHSFAFSNN